MQHGWLRSFRSHGLPHLGHEAIPLAGNRANQELLPTAVADRLAHRIDMAGESGLRDDPAAPDHLNQVVLGDDALAVLHQVKQQVEGLRPDRDRLELGRASCREGRGPSVWIPVGAGAYKKKKTK